MPRSPLVSLKRIYRKARKTVPIEWQAMTRRLPVQADDVLYESFAGNGMLCSPEAIFREFLTDPAQRHRKHIWVLSDPKVYSATVREFQGHPRVSFVKRRSPAYFKALATAGLLVNNATFPPEFNKRPGQVYLNTWHGTPLKYMGFDEPGQAFAARNVIRNFLMADYLLSSGPYMTSQMYESAYHLNNVYEGRVLEQGFPRVDRQFLDDDERAAVRDRLRQAGVSASDRIVLYAPTWRGESFYSPDNDVHILGERVRQLRSQLPEGTTVLLKVHQQVYGFAQPHADLRPFLVPNEIPTNLILGITDILVSDYSSIFFDFIATGRPIVFFTPDKREYAADRGTYLDLDDLPGPVATSAGDASALVAAVGTGSPTDPCVSHRSQYEQARQRFVPNDAGSSARRVLDTVLSRATDGPGVLQTARDGRPKILVFLGGMKANGITTSGLNLLASIDHTRFDVTAVYDHSRRTDRLRNANAIDPRVRRLARTGGFAPGKAHRRRRRDLMSLGTDMKPEDYGIMLGLLRDEWHRCFGSSAFDYVVDFSGYSPFWSFLISTAPSGEKSIWQHNDLLADQMRQIEGHRPHETNLASVFSSYGSYDHLVSVSPALQEINSKNLSRYAPPERFSFARNTIDHDRVLRMAYGALEVDPALDRPVESTLALMRSSELTLEESVAHVTETHGLESMRDEIDRRLAIATIVPPQEGMTTFVTIGRLSPEKNHERLLRAFDLVHQEDPATRLVIVGYGPLATKLERRAVELGLASSVTFAGLQANPYAILAHSDCFVLSSDYEGQPMVILEALVLGLPVVTTAFDSVSGALPAGIGLVVDRDVAALADGMRAALAGRVPNAPFDPQAYNREAMDEFYAAIGAARVAEEDTVAHPATP